VSALALKIVLLVTMTADHVAVIFLSPENPWYLWLRLIGRPAMPIACFLLVEGFLKTSSRGKYMLRMAVTAIIAELFWVFLWMQQTMEALESAFEKAGGTEIWGTYEKWFESLEAANHSDIVSGVVPPLNVLFTLLMCLVMLVFLDKLKKRFGNGLPNQVVRNMGYLLSVGAVLAVTVLIGLILQMDYALVAPIAVIVCFAVGKDRKPLMVGLALVGIIATFSQPLYIMAWMIALPLLYAYKGKLGYEKSERPWLRWAFYVYYPVHLAILVESRYFDTIFGNVFGR